MKNIKSKAITVIVRSWGDEPVQFLLYCIENNRCYFGGESSRRPIGLPFDQVFAFDSHRFSTLRKAWSEGKSGIFSDFTVDDFACNMYQDNVGSPHDQENITDSGCVTESSH